MMALNDLGRASVGIDTKVPLQIHGNGQPEDRLAFNYSLSLNLEIKQLL
jgi:hypothetical protein